jgi:hypothetical protein
MPTPLYGYRYNVETKQHEVSAAEAETVRRIYSLYTQGMPPAKIAALLNAEDVPTGLQSNGQRNTKGWTASRVSRLITYEQYHTGQRIANRFYGEAERRRKKLRRMAERPDSEWIVIPDTYPPIISQDLWLQAQAQRAANKTGATYNRTSANWLLTGKLRCLECGQLFACKQGSPKQKKRLAGGEIKEYNREHAHRYYKCYGLIHYPHIHNFRTPKSLSADMLEDIAWRGLRNALVNPAAIVAAVGEACDEYDQKMVALTEDVVKCKLKVDQQRAQQERNYRAYLKGTVPESLYEQEAARIAKAIASVREQVRTSKHEMEQLVRGAERGQELERTVIALEKRYAGIEDWTDADKRDAMERFVSRVTLDGAGNMKVYMTLPYASEVANEPQQVGRTVADTPPCAPRYRDRRDGGRAPHRRRGNTQVIRDPAEPWWVSSRTV